jgi:hypothetical protein
MDGVSDDLNLKATFDFRMFFQLFFIFFFCHKNHRGFNDLAYGKVVSSKIRNAESDFLNDISVS